MNNKRQTLRSPTVASSDRDLTNLDTLRAVAVTAVVVDHLILTFNDWNDPLLRQFAMRLGRLGVVAFFVHTCVVLMFSLERLNANSCRYVLAFYVRRAFRIYPLSICTVILAYLVRIPELPHAPHCAACYAGPNVVFNLLLIQNALGSSVIGPLWSLPYEVQMYVFLPIIFLVARSERAVWKVVGMLACAILLGALTRRSGTLQFVDFVPCFLSGVLAYVLRAHVRPLFHPACWLAVILAVFFLASGAAVRWWQQQILIGWLASFALGASIFLFRDCENRCWNKLTRAVATYSYGIYLLHVPCLWVVVRVLGITSPLSGTAISLALTAVMSVAAYYGVEVPMIRRGKMWASLITPTTTKFQLFRRDGSPEQLRLRVECANREHSSPSVTTPSVV